MYRLRNYNSCFSVYAGTVDRMNVDRMAECPRGANTLKEDRQNDNSFRPSVLLSFCLLSFQLCTSVPMSSPSITFFRLPTTSMLKT